MAEALIELRGIGLEVHSPVPTRILHPLDLDMVAGEAVTIMGPSGAGKTSLASIIGLLQPATEGVYRFAGNQISELTLGKAAALRAEHFGFVFQHSHLIEERTAIANVDLGLTDTRLRLDQRAERAHQALAWVELDEIAERRAGDLSGGERHRVAIARALVKSPRVVIADEPTAALDQATGQHILELLGTATSRGATVIIVTHDHRAADLADRVVTITDGHLS